MYISKEILQHGDRDKFSAVDVEQRLIDALRRPTGKMSAKNRWSPDGRFVEDYLLHKSLKIFQRLDILGFSVNPEHCYGINWTTIIAAVPNTKIIRFMRTNVIKTAVSGYRGQQMHRLCGVSNLRNDIDKGQNIDEFNELKNKNIHLDNSLSNINMKSNIDVKSYFNIGTHSSQQKCVVPPEVNWTVLEFAKEVSYWQVRHYWSFRLEI